MMISVYFLMFLSVLLGVIFAAGFVWAARTNQFKDIEEPIFRMMREDD